MPAVKACLVALTLLTPGLKVSAGSAALITCDGYGAFQGNTDLSGNLLSSAPADSADDCCSACDAIAGCEGFSFVMTGVTSGTCYFKSNVVGTYHNAGVVARVKAAPPSTCSNYGDEHANTDISGTLLAQKHAASADYCCGLCDGADSCQGFSFANQTCYLKSGVEGTYPNAGVVARVKPLPPSPPSSCSDYSKELEDTDISGNPLGQKAAASADYCCGLCDSTPSCQGFAFYQKECYLKSNVSGTYNHTGRQTRVKSKSAQIVVV